jgi:uncharacterized repeat protein (TIGR03803 family)
MPNYVLLKTRQKEPNPPIDTLIPVPHHAQKMNVGEKQFSPSRVASKPSARQKSNFLSLALAATVGLLPAGRAAAQAFTNLHSFVFTNGTGPAASLLLSGNTLYGTTPKYGGGSGGGSGSVFKLNTDGSGFTNLHTFSGGTDGGNLGGSLVLAGNTLYGTAAFGGGSNFGSVFAINTDGTGLTNVYNFPALNFASFPSTNTDGAYPLSGLVLAGGTLYGMANQGGTVGWGTVFAVTTNGGAFTNLNNFAVTNGQYPQGNLALSGSLLYGMTPDGGASAVGTIFKLGTDGTGFTNLYSFSYQGGYPYTNGDGASPLGGLVLSGGTLYGTASSGGSNACGTVFKVNTDGSGFRVLHQFSGRSGALLTNSDGANPQSGLVLFSNALYGTAMNGGSYGNGTVFRASTDGSDFTVLYHFTATNNVTGTNTDGAHPVGGLVQSGGVLYGTASMGGAAGYGTVFSILFPPPLSIALSGTNVVLTWPANITGFSLQSATNLAGTINWNAILGQSPVTNPVSGQQQFYRLMHP